MNVFYKQHSIVCGSYQTLNTLGRDIPRIEYKDLKDGTYYMMMMIDLDAPSGYFLHWWKQNITTLNLEGDTIVSYYPPTPPSQSGIHTYCMFVFEQKGKLEEMRKTISRIPFPLLDILKEYDIMRIKGMYHYYYVDTKEKMGKGCENIWKKRIGI
jgi:hypothetical protein